MVALLVSAWIEIFRSTDYPLQGKVALLVSAWIEIPIDLSKSDITLSRTPCECVD